MEPGPKMPLSTDKPQMECAQVRGASGEKIADVCKLTFPVRLLTNGKILLTLRMRQGKMSAENPDARRAMSHQD